MAQPHPAAVRMADVLKQREDIQREILEESLDGRESGRTLCGGDMVLEPRGRDYTSVQVRRCPRGESAMMHGGGGHDFRSPEHSLIDMGIVLFSEPRASMVVGSESSDIMYQPEDVDEAIAVFQDAVGEPVWSQKELADLLRRGGVEDPPMSRREIRERLSGCFDRVHINHNRGGQGTTAAAAPMTQSFVEAAEENRGRYTSVGERAVDAAQSIAMVLGSVFSFDVSNVEINFGELLVDEVATLAVIALFGGFR